MQPYSVEDKAALASLVGRYVTVWDRNLANNQMKAEIERWIAFDLQEFEKLHVAFSLYGINTKTPTAFNDLQNIFGATEYYRIINTARERNAAAAQPQNPPQQEVQKQSIEPPKVAPAAVESGETVRDLVLQYLKVTAPTGAKARPIRDYVEQVRGTTLHEKTIGMTLYRLSRDGLARRDGRTWFYVPPKAEAENPGGGSPGPSDLFE